MTSDRNAAAEERRVHREGRREAIAQDRGRSSRPTSGEAQRAVRNSLSGIADVPAVIAERVRAEVSKNADSLSRPMRGLRMSQVGTGTAVTIGAILGVAGAVKVANRSERDGNTVSGEVAVHLLKKIELLTIRLQVRQAKNGVNSRDRIGAFDVHRAEG
jgi:hypothetical protein